MTVGDPKQSVKISKFLSLILRHRPEVIDLELDENGWASTEELLQKLVKKNVILSFEELKEIVDTNPKKRFSFSEDFKKIRANQGHSLEIDLQLPEAQPPDILYHGTSIHNLASIRQEGILKRSRHHVHLSDDHDTALKVGSRHGKPVVLVIDAKKMHQQGIKFYRSENGVWLTKIVDCDFIIYHP